MADTAYATLVNSDTPECFWSLGEFTGTTAFDASGNGHDGTYSGTYTLFQDGIINGYTGRSTLFDNATIGGVTAASYVPYVTDSKRTFEVWIHPGPDNSGALTLFAGDGVGNPPGTPAAAHPTHELFHASGATHLSHLRYYSNVANFPLSWVDHPTPPGAWGPDQYSPAGYAPLLFRMNRAIHYVFTFDEDTGYQQLWVDGRPGPRWSGPGFFGVASAYNTTYTPGNLQFGFRGTTSYYASTTETYRGRAQCLAVYNRILTPAEIIEHYTAGRDPYLARMVETTPSLHWRLDQLSGTTARDASGVGYDGALTGSTAFGATGLVAGSDNKGASQTDASVSGIKASTYKPYTVGSKRTFAVWLSPSAKAGSSITIFGGSGVSGGAFNQPRPVLQWVTDSNSLCTEFRLWPTLNAIDYCSWAASSLWPFAATGGTYFVVLTMDDSAGVAELYLNGTSLGTPRTIGGNAPHWDTGADPGYFQFGYDGAGATGTTWTGSFDEVAIWERILTRSEIVSLWRLGETHLSRPVAF